MINWSSSVSRPLAHPVSGTMTTTTCLLMASWSAASSRLMPHLSAHPFGVSSSVRRTGAASLVTHNGGSNAEVLALHHCPRDPWVSRWRSRV